MRRAAAAAILVTAALPGALASGCGEDEESPPSARAVATAPPPARPAGLPAHVPGRGTLTAHITHDKVLWSRPGGGRRLAGMARRTHFRSPRIVTVVRRRGAWLGVLAPELPNGRVGWVDGRHGARLYRTDWSMEASLSHRRLVVRRGGRVFARARIAIGRPSAPTPRGRFAVTDRLTTGNPSGPYGCCVLALTGHQPSVPQGWGGGDLLAIHATPAEQTIGQAASLGCLRVTNAVMRRLLRAVPLGTRLRIRA